MSNPIEVATLALYAADDAYRGAVYAVANACSQVVPECERELDRAKARVCNAERAIIAYLRESRPRS